MGNDENTKGQSIEEQANALAEELASALAETVEAEAEVLVEDILPEELPTEEPMTEEATTEESPTEEATAEETATEETVTEEETVEEMPAAERKSRKVLWIVIGAIVAFLAIVGGVYYAISNHYSDRFFRGTSVNGVDCSENTIKEVEAALQKQVEEYVLVIVKADGSKEQIKGTDIGIEYVGYNQIKEAFAEQKSYLWPKSLFEKKDIKAEIVFDYNKEKLDEFIGTLECVKAENQTAPTPATIIYKDGTFVIQEETYGTQIDVEKMKTAIHQCVGSMNTNFDLKEQECYIQPMFKKDSPEVLAARDEMNKYLQANITYSMDGIEVNLNKETIAPWISVDANMVPAISTDLAKKFVNTLGSKYNTSDRSGILTTPTGKQVTIAKAGYGRKVGTDAETEKLVGEIKEGKTVTRQPVFSQAQTPEGQNVWGTTYVEVDITDQHMWYVVNGAVVFETDVVTGKQGKNDTPTGTYTILEKIKGKYLRGRLVNGKPSYVTWVDYWMRVTWSGIGFHDAPWQPTFGGDWYVNNGSHGCINMPPEKAKEFYSMLSNGTVVLIHY